MTGPTPDRRPQAGYARPGAPGSLDGTPRALKQAAEHALVWVRNQRARLDKWERVFEASPHCDTEAAAASLQPRRDTLRAIELCALTALDVAMFHDLYGDPSAPAPEVQDQR